MRFPMNRALMIVAGGAVVLLCAGDVPPTADSEVSSPMQRAKAIELELPPSSIRAWYKPENKRQVFLHKMFALRESLGAVELYAERGERERMVEWAGKFKEDYAAVPSMVPEWASITDNAAADALLVAAKSNDTAELDRQLDALRDDCNACHTRFSATTTALFRSPDYSGLKVQDSAREDSVSYARMMGRLAGSVTMLKISRKDGDLPAAQQAVSVLTRQLRDLEKGCVDCHAEASAPARILGADTFETLAELEASLAEPHDPKVSGRLLGTVGATVCGQCHSIHRTLGDLRDKLK